jgi:N-acetyl-gamma-glutamyl-phosphate reductase
VRFLPHVAEFFRGIHLSIAASLPEPVALDEVISWFQSAYAREPLVRVVSEAPEVAQVQEKHGVVMGGFALSGGGRHLAFSVVLDNLLKGAATQALQNLNLCLGLPELEGIGIYWTDAERERASR